ncbi:MAG: hypothetical protein HLUCCA05_11430 [Roseibaca calidilacus]|uniref:Uncharacterized protein n=1 Tax=Roseibaca calidilacus TaxID=1666912 RepID=A0A0P7X0T8_9RHOB|nr:MAG: hypothetical protein HLUCCA05_11430 [Roseibaca calidilacus]CUX80415.1 hypothetical protein Ga0058931_1123 [Roseibaca calidilacus]
MTRRSPTFGRRIHHLWRRAPVVTLVIGAALVVALIAALRLAIAVSHWGAVPSDPHLAGWMTPRFVAHSWDVPSEVVWQSLMLGPDGPARRITLAELAKAQNIPLPLLLEELRADIAAHRAEPVP